MKKLERCHYCGGRIMPWHRKRAVSCYHRGYKWHGPRSWFLGKAYRPGCHPKWCEHQKQLKAEGKPIIDND